MVIFDSWKVSEFLFFFQSFCKFEKIPCWVWCWKVDLSQGLLQYGPITELIFWKSYLETKSSKVLVISFEHLQKLCIFAKFGRHSSKIEPATPISISKCFGRKFKFERTKSLQILSKVVSYCDLQLVKIWYWYLKPLLINSKITNFALTF